MEAEFQEIKFSDADIVNYGNWIPKGEYNPHNVRPFLFHDHGFILCVVFADCLQDAMDEAVDEDKFDRYLVSEQELINDYKYDEESGECEHGAITRLGNGGEPFDIESLGVIELPNPANSFVAQFAAMNH